MLTSHYFDFGKKNSILSILGNQGLTLSGAKKKLKENKDGVIRNHEIIHHLKNIKSELIAIRDEFSVIEEISESDDTHNI